MMSLTAPETLIFIAITFLLGGMAKGVLGFGLPTISLTILALGIDLKQAIALIIVPTFFTNFWQAMAACDPRHLSPFVEPDPRRCRHDLVCG